MAGVLKGDVRTKGFTTDDGNHRYLHLYWSATQSISTNTTTISWRLIGTGGYEGWVYTRNIYVDINGKRQYTGYTNSSIALRNGTEVAKGTYKLTHKNDGTASLTIKVGGGIYNHDLDYNGSDSWQIETIPRASKPSLITYPNSTYDIGDIGRTITIYMNRKSSEFSHKVQCTFGGYSEVIGTGIGSSMKWTIPTDFLKQLPKSQSGTGKITVSTYKEKQKIGSDASVSFLVHVPKSYAPKYSSFKVEAVDQTTKTLTGNSTTCIKGISTMRAYLGGRSINSTTGKKSCYVKDSSGINHGLNPSDSAPGYEIFDFAKATSTSYVGYIIDNRNFTTITNKVTPKMIPYVAPTCDFKVNNLDMNGNTTISFWGSYFSGSFGAQQNQITLKYQYRDEETTEFNALKSVNIEFDGNAFTAKAEISGLDYQKTYYFRAIIQDKIQEKETKIKQVRSVPIFKYNNDIFNFNVPITLKEEQFYTDTTPNGGINLNNSDIVGTNAIYFDDEANSSKEGLRFYVDGTNWDTLRAYKGGLFFTPNNPINTVNYKVPCIVAEGDSNDWHYIKYDNHIAVCWMRRKIVDTISVSWGSIYRSQSIPFIKYPFTFTSTPYEFATFHSTYTGWIGNYKLQTSSQSGEYYIFRASTTDGDVNLYIDMLVIGKW